MNDHKRQVATFEVEVEHLANEGQPSPSEGDIQRVVEQGLSEIGEFYLSAISVRRL